MERLHEEFGEKFSQVFKTITVDNGAEFADFAQIEKYGSIVKGFGANHLLFREELAFAGITDTSINRPLFITHLRNDPLNKRRTLVNAVRLVAILSVCLVHSVPTLCAIAGSTALTACSGRCTAL